MVTNWKNYGLNNYPKLSQIIIALGIFLVFYFVFQLVVVAGLYLKYGIKEVIDSSIDNSHINTLKWLQLICSIGAFGLPAVLLAYLKRPNPLAYINANKKPSLLFFAIGMLMMMLCLPLLNTTFYYNQLIHFGVLDDALRKMELQNAVLTKAFLNVHTWYDLVFNIVLIGLVAGVVEELLFRGVLQNMFHEIFNNIHISIFITAALFSTIHFQFLGFFPRMLMGILLGYMYAYSGNILISITAHFFNNASQVVLAYFFYNNMSSMDIDKVNSPNWLATILSAIALVALIVWMKKNTAQPTELVQS